MPPDAPQPYGAPIALEAAKKVAAPAVAEAARNNWAMAVAVVDGAGDLVYFERMDATQAGSVMHRHRQGALGGTVQTSDQSVSRMLATGGDGWRVLGTRRRGTSGRRRPDCHRRQDRWRGRRLRRHEPAGWPVRPGRCRGNCDGVTGKAVFLDLCLLPSAFRLLALSATCWT